MFMNLFTNTLLYLSLTHLIVELKLRLELNLFAKQKNINNFFLELNLNYLVFINNMVNL